MNNFLIGWALAMTVITLLCAYLLYKKVSESTTNNIDKLRQNNRRNRDSTIDNDISASVTSENIRKREKKPKNGIFKRLTKRKQNEIK